MPRVVTLQEGSCQVSTDKTVLAADGVEVCTVYVTAKQNRNDANLEKLPMPGLAASNVTIAVTPSTGVTITQPTSNLDEDGATTATFVSTNAATVSVTATILGVAVTGGATVVVGGAAPVDPPDGDPFFTDDFAGTQRNNDNGFTWGSGGSRVTVASFDGFNCLRFRFGPDADGADSSAEQRFNMGRAVSHGWLEYDLHIPANYAHRTQTGSTNNKFLALWRDTYSDVTGGTWRIFQEVTRGGAAQSNCRFMSSLWDRNTATDSFLIYGPNGTAMIGGTGPIAIDAWNQIRIEWSAASAYGESDGIWRMWVNGTLYGEMTNGKFWNFDTATDPADCYLQNGYFMGWSNSGFTDETLLHIKGVKFYDTDPGWLP